jgi:hypothetical protein
VVGVNPGYLDMYDLVSGNLITFLGLGINSDELIKSLKDKAKDTMSLSFDTDFSPGSATINPGYKETSESKANDRTVTVDFWFTLFEMQAPPPDSIIPEIVFKCFRLSETATNKQEFPLRFKRSTNPAPEDRFYYHVNIPIKGKDGTGGYSMKNLWNGENAFPTSEADLKDQMLLSKQWYYFRVSLVRYYEVKSYYLQVLIYSPSNPKKIILYLDKDISSKIDGMTVDLK